MCFTPGLHMHFTIFQPSHQLPDPTDKFSVTPRYFFFQTTDPEHQVHGSRKTPDRTTEAAQGREIGNFSQLCTSGIQRHFINRVLTKDFFN